MRRVVEESCRRRGRSAEEEGKKENQISSRSLFPTRRETERSSTTYRQYPPNLPHPPLKLPRHPFHLVIRQDLVEKVAPPEAVLVCEGWGDGEMGSEEVGPGKEGGAEWRGDAEKLTKRGPGREKISRCGR